MLGPERIGSKGRCYGTCCHGPTWRRSPSQACASEACRVASLHLSPAYAPNEPVLCVLYSRADSHGPRVCTLSPIYRPRAGAGRRMIHVCLPATSCCPCYPAHPRPLAKVLRLGCIPHDPLSSAYKHHHKEPSLAEQSVWPCITVPVHGATSPHNPSHTFKLLTKWKQTSCPQHVLSALTTSPPAVSRQAHGMGRSPSFAHSSASDVRSTPKRTVDLQAANKPTANASATAT